MSSVIIGEIYTINQEETMEKVKQLWSQGVHLWTDHKKVVIGVAIVIIIIGLLLN